MLEVGAFSMILKTDGSFAALYKSRSGGWRETMIKFVMGSFSKVSLRTILWLSGDITSVFRLQNFNQKKKYLPLRRHKQTY